MNPYLRSLDDLAGAVAHNVLDPTQGFDALQGLVNQRREQKVERRAAQQDALASLAQLAYESSMEGTSADQLMANPAFQSGASSLKPRFQGQLQDSLASLYTPQGISTLAPKLDAEDMGAIADSVVNGVGTVGVSTPESLRKYWEAQLTEIYGPDSALALMPAVDETLKAAYQRQSDIQRYTFGNG